MRVRDWEIELAKVVEKHIQIPFAYGVSDCYIVCADVVKAITGEEPYENVRDYTTEAGAAKQLKKHGFESVEDAWAAKFEEIPPVMAQRGDVCIFDTPNGPAGAPVTSSGAFLKTPDDFMFVTPMGAKRAFRVA